ncbi:MAG TPA: phytanoyl-CoA dioxygenase family protein [Abditibacterium sp.]|jgi:2-oxoglutarate-dependent dioxygenase
MTISDPIETLQLTPNEIRFYREEGFLYLPGVVSRETASQIAEDVTDVMLASGKTADDLRSAAGQQGKLVQSSQYLAGSALDSYVNSPSLCSLAAQLMEGEATLYMPFSAVKAGGGGGTFHFHQDNQYTRFDGPGINLWMALSPMSPENGCLMVVPRSHLAGTADSISPDGDGHRAVAEDPTRFLPIRMNPGDVIAFSRLTIHGSGVNNTSEPRLAYAVQFHRDDVKAIWDGQEPRLLKENPRWRTGPVAQLTPPDAKGRDGH